MEGHTLSANYAAQLEQGIVSWLDTGLSCRVVGYSQDKDPERTLPVVSVVCSPTQDWQGLCEVSIRVNVLTNAIRDTTREESATIMGTVRSMLDNDNAESINALVPDGLLFAGFSPWDESEADVLTTESEATNVLSVGCTGFCALDPDWPTTTTTTTIP